MFTMLNLFCKLIILCPPLHFAGEKRISIVCKERPQVPIMLRFQRVKVPSWEANQQQMDKEQEKNSPQQNAIQFSKSKTRYQQNQREAV